MRPSRYDDTGNTRSTSRRWDLRRLNPPNRLWGSNGVTFGPDGRLYVAQFLAGQISAVDTTTGDVDVVVPLDGPVQAPDDLAFGADGSMYIADLTPGRVWRRSPEGAYSLVSDQVQVPNGITCVGDRLFVNEMKMNGRLLELFPDGGDPVVLTDGLALGNAMQLGPDGCLYYPHMIGNQVWRIPPDGGTPELFAEEVDDPVAVRFDKGGVLVVLSRGPAGIVTRIDLATGARSVVVSGVLGLDNAAFDAENRMFVSSFGSGGVTEMHEDGRTREIVPRGLSGPFGVTVDLRGTVYAADHYRLASPGDSGEHDSSGVITHELQPFVHGITADDGLLHFASEYGDVRTYDPVRRTTRVRVQGLNEPTGIERSPDGALVVAESGAGRVVRIDGTDTVTVLAEGLRHPVDIAFDTEGRCYVSDDELGAVLRIDDGEAVAVADGLGAPQGLTVRGDELFTVDVQHRCLRAVSLTTGETRIDAEDLAVGLPPGITRTEPALFAAGMPGSPHPFAGLTAAPDGTLLLSANGEGSVVSLSARSPSEE
ncbi:Vgb family protein [Streptomyces phaeochromogenes]